ncbi:BA14K-like protein [Hartmannibacter diazotrophicus]|uniref:Lectin-like protein BA14k n=1 Tax=Hartmannibacter diazotrophicus TaxID=1482074 RepID=A0A2C9D717_9HYPH|nr:BA14K family protein [Hartmannibacter diazotrophicus]SON55969.1 BA14K-like protein [Hartmannibacter diazotrophicus]
MTLEKTAHSTSRLRRTVTAATLACVAATTFTLGTAPLTASTAYADGYRHHHYGDRGWGPPPRREFYHRDRDRNRSRDALAAGALGVVAGALLGATLAPPPPPRVIYTTPVAPYEPPVVRYQPPPRIYSTGPVYQNVEVVGQAGGYEPYSDGWYDYCSARYRTFDARSGTYMGYDGLRHFCQ